VTFLPIVGRELRVAARRWLTYWGRTIAVLVAIILGLFVYLATDTGGSLAFADALFGHAGLLHRCFTACSLWGWFHGGFPERGKTGGGNAGDWLCSDRPAGHDVILGKLAATSLNGFYALLADSFRC